MPPFLAAFFFPAFLAAFFLAGLAAFFVAFFAMVFIVLKTYLRRSKKIFVHENNFQHSTYQQGFVEKDDYVPLSCTFITCFVIEVNVD